LTKEFYCPYYGAVATLFLKTLEKNGFHLLKRVIAITIVLMSCGEDSPYVAQRQLV
jgi:hypothetical protein